MKKSPLYTGCGDRGVTSLVGGVQVSKTHPRLEAYGTIDELNSFIGLLMTEIEDAKEVDLLTFVQHKLFSVGSYLATDTEHTRLNAQGHITSENIQHLERAIDHIDSGLPKMRGFVLPGRGRSAALAHICRTVCRRAERAIYRLVENEVFVEEAVLIFMNRLSDLLFVMARNENLLKNEDEIIWDNACN